MLFLVGFVVSWRLVLRVQLHRHGSRRQQWRGLEPAGIFAGEGGFHEIHPQGQRGAGAGFFIAQGLLFVVAHPDATGDRGGEADKPGVGEIVGRTGLTRQRVLHAAGGDGGAVLDHALEHCDHDAGGAGADYVLDVGIVFFEHAAFVVGHLGDVTRA